MTDAKAPERIWADVIVWGDMEPLAGEWNCRDVGRTEDTEYIRKDLYDALAKERDELMADSAAAWDKCEERRLAQEKAEAEVERLREALRDIYNSGQTDEPDHWRFRVLARDTARAALQRKEGNE